MLIKRDILKKISTPSAIYVIINIIVCGIGFIRSMVFMRWLGLEELGLISLAQTVMQFISLFQFGLINGGFRMYSLNRVKEQIRVNNLLFSIFFILMILFLVAWIIIVISGRHLIMDNGLLLVAIIVGVLMLTNNWLNNTLIGTQRLREINFINIVSITISLGCLAIVPIIGFWGAVLSISSQSFCFVLLSLIRNKELRPTKYLIDWTLIREILSYGFIPFLAGIFVMLNFQVERWSIAGFLGKEALGCFYLVFLYNTLFMLIPNAIHNIFFPKAVRSYDENKLSLFKSIIKKQTFVTLLYDVSIILITILLLKPFVSLFFPLHVDNIVYVYLFIPGLIALSFESVTSLVLNSSLRLKVILLSSFVGLLTNLIGILILKVSGTFSLEAMAILKSLVIILPFLLCLSYIIINWGNIKNGYSD